MEARRSRHHRRSGFTLIETAIATMVVGLGILALLNAMASGTRVNHEGQNITQAVFLAQQIREWTLNLPFADPTGSTQQPYVDDLSDLADVTYSPPVDAEGNPITSLPQWSQYIQEDWRDPNSLTTSVPAGSSNVICVTVTISHQNVQVLKTSWMVFRRSSS